MHQFVNGEWLSQAEYEATNEDGEFERQTTSFRDFVGEQYPVASGRYHLYVSYACPWAHRTLITRKLKGLEGDISVDYVDPYRDEDGWQFTPGKKGCSADSVNGFDYLRQAYVEADPEYTGRVTVPVLWDKDEGTIVNNESKEVMRMLDTAFEGNGVDLYPEGYRDEVDEAIEAIYEPINNGVYRAGFAESQKAYDSAVRELFNELDRWNDTLEGQRYLAGDRLTEADIAMYTTLIRFDQVYHTHFRCNRKQLHEYDTLWPYLRDLYQTPGFGETTNMAHIKEHYYTTHDSLNPKKLIPVGPDLDFEAPHGRDALPGDPPRLR